MDSSGTFIFEVVFRGETQGLSGNARSVIVEVEPDSMVQTPISGPSGEAARQSAEELAPEVAMQVVQKDLPHGFEPPYSVVQIDQLPRHLQNRPPKFHGNRFRAWML
jgi:hypothetical protein